MQKIVVFWFRRDLRLHDNHGLFHALKSGLPVLPVFIFDTDILDKPDSKTDARVSFIYREITRLKTILESAGSSLFVSHSTPLNAFEKLVHEFEIDSVFTNHDYEPYAIKRDKAVADLLKSKGIGFHSFKDQVIFEKDEVTKEDGLPYTIFTPYSRKWKQALEVSGIKEYPSEKLLFNLTKTNAFSMPGLRMIGFENSEREVPNADVSEIIIRNYGSQRDFPSMEGTTKLGVHLRFGTVSIRQIVQLAQNWSVVFLSELIWREFFMQILWHFPHVEKNSFKSKYDFIAWRNNENEFYRWCNGQTGYPLVDAGMRELNATGFMHNRVRMVAASFLTKHLLIDWRWGEAYFAEKLLDFELASNNGNWQWAAGCGCDAAPYFRVFNPRSQQKKFDPDEKYIRKWVTEYGTSKYTVPIVEHVFARDRALSAYRKALS